MGKQEMEIALKTLIAEVNTYAMRPTKNGSKKLRELTDKLKKDFGFDFDENSEERLKIRFRGINDVP